MSNGDRRRRNRKRRERDPLPETDTGADTGDNTGDDAESDPDFLAGGVHERQLELLIDMSALGRPLIALVGEAGIGKTTFCRALLERLPEAACVARISAGVLLSPQALLRTIAPAMGLEFDADAAADVLRAQLRAQVLELQGSGTPCVFVVDDACELDAGALEELVQLAELAASDGAGIRIILFSLPGIREALVRAAGEARVDLLFHELALGRHSVDELRGFLQFRLARAGQAGASPSGETDWPEIFRRASEPRGRADDVAGRTLGERRSNKQANLVPLIAGCLTAAVLLVVVVLTFSGQAPDGDPDPAPVLSQAAPAMPPSALDRADGAATDLQGSDAMGAEPRSPAPPPSAGADSLVAPAGDAVIPPPAPADDEDTPRDRVDPADGMDRSDATMLLAADPARFTIQLLVTSTAERAGGWVAAQPRPEAFRQFERVRRSGSQFVVVHGEYADLTAASNALDRVSNETGIAELWIRPMADIQGEIRGE